MKTWLSWPEKTLDRIFYALSDPSRRTDASGILASQDCQVKDLANFFSFSKAATSKHIAVLEKAGLIDKTRAGREVLCSINPSMLQTAGGVGARLSSVLE